MQVSKINGQVQATAANRQKNQRQLSNVNFGNISTEFEHVAGSTMKYCKKSFKNEVQEGINYLKSHELNLTRKTQDEETFFNENLKRMSIGPRHYSILWHPDGKKCLVLDKNPYNSYSDEDLFKVVTKAKTTAERYDEVLKMTDLNHKHYSLMSINIKITNIKNEIEKMSQDFLDKLIETGKPIEQKTFINQHKSLKSEQNRLKELKNLFTNKNDDGIKAFKEQLLNELFPDTV